MARESINFTTYLVISISKDIHKKFKILTFQINRKYWKVSINIPKIIFSKLKYFLNYMQGVNDFKI